MTPRLGVTTSLGHLILPGNLLIGDVGFFAASSPEAAAVPRPTVAAAMSLKPPREAAVDGDVIRSGGQLALFAPKWTRAPPLPATTVRRGFHWAWASDPPPLQLPSSTQRQPHLLEPIQDWVKKGVVVPVPRQPCFLSHLFAVPRPDGCPPRLIIDLSRLNQFILAPTFSLVNHVTLATCPPPHASCLSRLAQHSRGLHPYSHAAKSRTMSHFFLPWPTVFFSCPSVRPQCHSIYIYTGPRLAHPVPAGPRYFPAGVSGRHCNLVQGPRHSSSSGSPCHVVPARHGVLAQHDEIPPLPYGFHDFAQRPEVSSDAFSYLGQLYFFHALPSGLNVIPFIFTQVLAWPIQCRRDRGISLLAYLDDIVIWHRDRDTLLAQVHHVMWFLQDMGFWLNMTKSLPYPTDSMIWLSVRWFHRTLSVRWQLPSEGQLNIRTLALDLLHAPWVTSRQLERLVGVTVSSARSYSRSLRSTWWPLIPTGTYEYLFPRSYVLLVFGRPRTRGGMFQASTWLFHSGLFGRMPPPTAGGRSSSRRTWAPIPGPR